MGNNIWNKEDFRMCGLGEKCKLVAKIKHTWKCLKWSRQRIVRGYADCDKWEMFDYLQHLIPDMLQDFRDNRMGSPGYLGEKYIKACMFPKGDCHEEWNKILDQMIYIWRESAEDTCTRKNPYAEEYYIAHQEFDVKYGLLGGKLLPEEELEESQKRGGGRTRRSMSEMPEYKDISEKYLEEECKLQDYRSLCKDEAFDLLKEYFFALWD